MRGRALFLFALASSIPASAHAGIGNGGFPDEEQGQLYDNFGKCVLAKLYDGTKLELADRVVDSAVRACKQQLAALGGLSELDIARRAKAGTEMVSRPETFRDLAILFSLGVLIKEYEEKNKIRLFNRLKEANNAGGNNAVSTAGSK